MNNLEDVKKAMDANPVLENDLKENILELVSVFQKTFSEVGLANLCHNLKTLKVEKTSSFISHEAMDYNPKVNKLTINVKELEKVKDTRNLLMNIIIRLIASRNGMVGFDNDGNFLALNLGYIAGITNMLVGNEEEHDRYTDEIVAVNIFGKIIGDDILQEAFFQNNPSLIIDQVSKGEN